jgi:transcriptional regulator
MYQPPHFRDDDRERQFALIRSHPFALLITSGAGGLMANAAPFILDAEQGVLRAHLARANPQWQDLPLEGPGLDVLVVFQGVDHYITPGWYETKRETGKVVPTWNYAMVQVQGKARATHDAQWLRAQIGALTEQMEGPRSAPWAVEDAPDDFVRSQIKGIVGIEVEIVSTMGKWKLSQNRNAADRAGVVEGLRGEARETAQDMARMVADAMAQQVKDAG